MATDYGNTIFEGELSPSVPIVQPIDNKSGQYLAQGIKATIDNTSSILFSSDAKAARADAAKNGLFAEIAEYTSFLADAKEQGRSTDEVSRLLRVKSLEWVANNPNMTDEIYTFLNKMTTDNGIGGNIRKETPLETGNRQKIEAATKDGWDVSTPEGMAAYDKQLILQNRLKQLETDISLATSQGRMVTAQMQNEATLTLHGIVQTGTTWVNTQIEKANQLLSGVQDPKARTAIIQQTKAQIAQQLAFIGSTRSASGNAIDTSYLTAGVENIMKVWEETVNGTADLAAYETALKSAETSNLLMVYQTNPKLAMLAAMNKASPFEMTDLIRKMDQEMINTYTKLMDGGTTNADGTVTQTNKPPDLVETTENIGLVTEALKGSTKALLSDKSASPEAVAAQGVKLSNAIRSVVAYGGNDTDAKNFMAVVDLFSDTAVGRFLESNPNMIDPGVATQAQQIIQQQYEGTVLPLINEEWATVTALVYSKGTGNTLTPAGRVNPNPNDSQVDSQDLSNVIEPIWNGAGIEFKVKDEFSSDPTLRGVAKKLNTEVAGAVNRLVRTHAHLVGTTDYEKIYNEQYASRLFVTPDKPTDTGTEMDAGKKTGQTANQIQTSPMTVDNPSDLDLEDFSDAEFKKIVEGSKAKDPQALMTATSPTEIAQAYLGMSENNAEQVKVLSSFISRNAGLSINPATTAWCAAFVDAVLGAGGSKGTGKLNARSYLAWGVPVDTPAVGDVVVLQLGSGVENDWRGHVGFYMGINADGTIRVLGGNQGDSVSEDDFDANKVLGFRRAG